MKRNAYMLICGLNPDTAALTSLLAEAGVVRPDTRQPLDEAMILGIGGGLGIGYILWEFQAHALRILVMGMRNQWQYSMALPDKLEQRLNLRFAVAETTGARGALAALDAALGLGRPAMLWVDAAHLPYRHLPATLDGACGHTIVAYGMEEGYVLIDDRAARPFRLTQEELASARGRVPSYKNRLLTVDAAGDFDMELAVRAGLSDCAAHLAQPSDSFSLPVIRKWARLMTDARNAKGWPRVFVDGQGLFSTLVSVFESVTDYGSSGGSLRGIYADFLEIAASMLNNLALRDVAARYRWLGKQWGSLGESALPTAVTPFAQAKALIARRQMVYAAQGGDGLDELAAIADELESLRATCDHTFPLDNLRTRALFEQMQAELNALFAAENEANRALGAALAQYTPTSG